MIAKFSSPLADVDPDSNYFNEIFTSVDGANTVWLLHHW